MGSEMCIRDSLGGSYLVETLTTEMEKNIFSILDQVDKMGGTIQAIEDGWFQREIADSAYKFAVNKASGDTSVFGVYKYVEDSEAESQINLHPYDPGTEVRQIANLQRVRQCRNDTKVQNLLGELLVQAKSDSHNLIPVTIELVKARASMGEIIEALRGLWGTYRETPVI